MSTMIVEREKLVSMVIVNVVKVSSVLPKVAKTSMNVQEAKYVLQEQFVITNLEHLYVNVHLEPTEIQVLDVPNQINVSAMPFVQII
jgi:hypothetical protein